MNAVTTDETLEAAALENLKAQVAKLGEGDCDTRTLSAAQRIAEPKFDKEGKNIGGKPANVYAVLPQVRDDVLRGKDARINVDGNDTVDRPELTAALVAAAQIAHKRHIKLEEVPIEDIAKLTPSICEQLVKGASTCKAQ